MEDPKLIIVSNRLPISVTKENGKLHFSESTGGLATAMQSLPADTSRLWIGWPGIASDELTPGEKRQVNNYLAKRGYVPVHLSTEQIDLFYSGYSNDTLWPLFHYFGEFTHYRDDYWQSYKQVNQLFAKVIKKHIDARDTVWVQDYHLMLLPSLIRADTPEARIGFFLHIPFPSYEVFRLLPERQAILKGLLGADLIGFHVYDYARHFLSSCTRLLNLSHTHDKVVYDDRSVTVDSFPIGVDYSKFQSAALSDGVKVEIDRLREHYPDKKLILSVDRLDYTKGIVHRLEAFEQFLQTNPKFHKQVCLVMVAVPSRIDVETYQTLRETVEKTVSRINGEFGSIDWTPISYQFQGLPYDELVALYAAADVALVTPLRDGMNLVAKEYIASRATPTGVLILSEMTGAIDEMPESIKVNPSDRSAVARAIKTALTMPKAEQSIRLASMQRRIARYNVQRWGNDFISQLEDVTRSNKPTTKKQLTTSTVDEIKQAHARAKNRLLLLDYDGTLKEFTSSLTPELARPPRALLALIEKLATAPGTTLCIVSGRDHQTLQRWFGKLPIILVAEHGAYVKTNGSWQKTATSFDKKKRQLRPILDQFVDRTPGSLVEEKDFSLVWHYRDVPTELAYIRTLNLKHDLRNLIKGTTTGMFDGNKIVEIKPRSITKGHAATTLQDKYNPDFILCIGDDFTDEDMFRGLPESAYTIHVGHKDETVARYTISDVPSVRSLLRKLTDK
ncbi:MAG: bifunctional alpha,alpha-trehalose-phosphate synthase (UDP-forming)/trehalose-phosphatase [bacterium]|nr:bifunctional alpha,alpha-trehalose-phosphate synthase (UDP-forming)/trehalose-phosphatase [bacterium]MDN5835513.1 bifunctional alpha,alpha-trehalose-phosphate synthase (UDP-forming)/trehalose-phosphatase [bacterium]